MTARAGRVPPSSSPNSVLRAVQVVEDERLLWSKQDAVIVRLSDTASLPSLAQPPVVPESRFADKVCPGFTNSWQWLQVTTD
jgi:hypothetical protein